MIGQTVSHYKILEKLGEGGMGVVYKAQDTSLDRTVALKFLPDHVATGSGGLDRFVQEAKAAAGLNHPNICTIYGIEEYSGKNFIVMEFVDGQTLQEKKSSLSMKQALDVGIQIAEGLAAAHEKGIVHRDIKPENIMVRKDGRVQIMDFGLAKLRGASRLTKEGSTVGTAGYMSPEQIQGQETDHRSDIFSLGVVLYEMLAGTSPFKGVHETAVIYEIVNVDTPPPSTVRSEVTPELDTIVLECLEKDPRERTQSAGQVALDLKRYRRSSSRSLASVIAPARTMTSEIGATGSSTVDVVRRIPRWFMTLAGAAVMLTAGFLLSFLRTAESSGELRKFTWPMKADQAFLSPDGKKIATTAGKKITIRRLDSTDPVTVECPDDVQWLIWAPNSDQLAYFTDRGNYHELLKVSVLGMGQSAITRMESNSFPRYWGMDDSLVVSTWDNTGRNTLLKVASSGGPLVPMYGGDSTLCTIVGNLSHVLELPDGRSQLLSINNGKVNRLVLQSGGVRRDLYSAPQGGFINKSACANDGYVIFTQMNVSGGTGEDLWALPFDASALVSTGKAFIVARNSSNVSVSSNGLMAYEQRSDASPGEELVILDRSGRLVDVVQRSASQLFGPSVWADGSSLALNETDLNSLQSDIWLYDVHKKTRSQFSIDVPFVWGAAWSPDGNEIAYVSGYFDTVDVYIQSTNSLSPAKPFLNSPAIEYAPRYSPDRQTLFYTRREQGNDNSDIWFTDRKDQGSQRPLFESRFRESFPFPSPDGRFVAYQSDRSGQDEIYVTRFPEADQQWQVSFSGGIYPQWVGHEIFFVDQRANSLMSASVSIRPNFRAELPQKRFSATDAEIIVQAWWTSKFAVMDGGKRIVAARRLGEEAEPMLVLVENWINEFRSKR